MNSAFMFLMMAFFHIVDDYCLQGILASMKQKQWWKENAPDDMYKHDYIVALIMHSSSWSFMIMLPIAIASGFCVGAKFIYAFIANATVHCIVDDMKANKRKINLIADQTIHLLQVAITATMFLEV